MLFIRSGDRRDPPVVSVGENVHQNWQGMLHRVIVDYAHVHLRQIVVINVECGYVRRDVQYIREIAVVLLDVRRVLSYAVYQLGNVATGIIYIDNLGLLIRICEEEGNIA